MFAAAAILVLALLVGTVLVSAGMRRLAREESEVERRLRRPDAHTISYAVPNGVDPGEIRVAAARGGFTSIQATSGTRECLVVECQERDRARLRQLIADAHKSAYDGSESDLQPVVFEDEL
jgi:hypothetical protein